MTNKQKFTEAFNDYYPLVMSIIHAKVYDPDDAEDVCQEIFLSLYKKIDSIDDCKKWLYGALRIEVLAYYRKKKNSNIDIEEVFNDSALSFVNGLRDARIIIQEAIENSENFKDEIDRILFDLIAIYNFTYSEAGSHLGLTQRQVRYRYGQIAARMVQYLSRKGIASLEEIL